MDTYKCSDCKSLFNGIGELKAHKRKCEMRAFNLGPSFKCELAKKMLLKRRQIMGTYEWALLQSNSEASPKLKLALSNKSKAELELSIIKLEHSIVFSACPTYSDIKRLIALSHTHDSLDKKLTKQANKRKREMARKEAVRKMNEATKPEIEASSDIFDIHYRSGNSLVVSGGLPSLGKRK